MVQDFLINDSNMSHAEHNLIERPGLINRNSRLLALRPKARLLLAALLLKADSVVKIGNICVILRPQQLQPGGHIPVSLFDPALF